jgi:Uncharacterized conserved protein (COG2071)
MWLTVCEKGCLISQLKVSWRQTMKIAELGHYHHLFVNYHVAAEQFHFSLPPSLEWDLFEGRPVVSWVASTLQDFCCLGTPWKFPEQAFSLSVRTYVKQRQGESWLKGYLPLNLWMSGSWISKAHFWLGLGKTQKLAMKRSVHFEPYEKSSRGVFEYQWPQADNKKAEILRFRTVGTPEPAMAGYLEFFTVEKCYRFLVQGDSVKIVHEQHSPWVLWEIDESILPQTWPTCPALSWAESLVPKSLFVVKGSRTVLSSI